MILDEKWRYGVLAIRDLVGAEVEVGVDVEGPAPARTADAALTSG